MRGTLVSEGERFQLVASKMECRVIRFLGAGGQGEVYETTMDGGDTGPSYALKCFFGPSATQQQWDALVSLVEMGPPDDRFLWPIDLVRLPEAGTFGYLMLKRDRRFHSLVDLLNQHVTTTFKALATAGFSLADSYLRLHSRGLCYRDISFGNMFFDPDTGDVLICDNDNVAFDGRGQGGILGTPRFMAPEIVRGEAEPSTRTDLFSLPVLLFYMFIRHHPLQGARELDYTVFDDQAFADLFGRKPVFIYDPDDTSNEPVPGHHDNAMILWPLYPQMLRDLFTRSFTTGLANPNAGRVAEVSWKTAMVRMRDCITYCGRCGAQNFLDIYSSLAVRPPEMSCWSCGASVSAPYRLLFKREGVLLNHDTQLFPHHLHGATFEFGQPVAAVTPHPSNPDVWGLRNLSGQNWVASRQNGDVHDILPGRTVRLEDGLRIHFPGGEGTIRW